MQQSAAIVEEPLYIYIATIFEIKKVEFELSQILLSSIQDGCPSLFLLKLTATNSFIVQFLGK